MIGKKSNETRKRPFQKADEGERSRQHGLEFFLLDGAQDRRGDGGGVEDHELRGLGGEVVEAAAKIRRHRAGADDRHMDAMRLELVIKALGKTDLREFGAAVKRHLRRAD